MINRFGVISKSGKPGKWCLIFELSAQAKFIIIYKTDASIVYSLVADAARMILSLGQGTKWPTSHLRVCFLEVTNQRF